MHSYNPYVAKYKQFALQLEKIPTYKMILKADSSIDRRIYNKPNASEVAVILPSNYIIYIKSKLKNFN
jgi:hypothetical protein